MNTKLMNITKSARREAAKQQGAYDGRFGHRVYTDRKAEYSRNLCRQEVEVPVEEEDEVVLFDAVDGEGPSTYTEEVSYNPFAAALS